MFSLELGGNISPVRIAGHMVTGVGFLCVGVIMEAEERVVGLTTASVIWFTAAIGMGIGRRALLGRPDFHPGRDAHLMGIPKVREIDLQCQRKANL